jgi:hypothetical protein
MCAGVLPGAFDFYVLARQNKDRVFTKVCFMSTWCSSSDSRQDLLEACVPTHARAG